MSPDLVASELQADVETVKRTARRYKEQFTVIPGGNLALLELMRRTQCPDPPEGLSVPAAADTLSL